MLRFPAAAQGSIEVNGALAQNLVKKVLKNHKNIPPGSSLFFKTIHAIIYEFPFFLFRETRNQIISEVDYLYPQRAQVCIILNFEQTRTTCSLRRSKDKLSIHFFLPKV